MTASGNGSSLRVLKFVEKAEAPAKNAVKKDLKAEEAKKGLKKAVKMVDTAKEAKKVIKEVEKEKKAKEVKGKIEEEVAKEKRPEENPHEIETEKRLFNQKLYKSLADYREEEEAKAEWVVEQQRFIKKTEEKAEDKLKEKAEERKVEEKVVKEMAKEKAEENAEEKAEKKPEDKPHEKKTEEKAEEKAEVAGGLWTAEMPITPTNNKRSLKRIKGSATESRIVDLYRTATTGNGTRKTFNNWCRKWDYALSAYGTIHRHKLATAFRKIYYGFINLKTTVDRIVAHS